MLETTPARVAGPRAPAATEEPVPDTDLRWEPRDLPRAVRSRRTYRIPVVLLALMVAAGAYVGFRAALQLPAAWAEGHLDTYHAAMEEAAASMPGLREAIATVTDPAADPGAATVALVRANTAAAGLQEAADRGLPPDLPFVPDGERDLLPPLRDRMQSIADRTGTVVGLLEGTASYRSGLAGMFLLPDPPDAGPTVDRMADGLSAMLTATVEHAAGLPDVGFLAGHRGAVNDLIEWIPEWQAAYLDALRDGDLESAGELRGEAERRIAALKDGLAGPLEQIAAHSEGVIVLLERDLEVTMLLTG